VVQKLKYGSLVFQTLAGTTMMSHVLKLRNTHYRRQVLIFNITLACAPKAEIWKPGLSNISWNHYDVTCIKTEKHPLQASSFNI
jgi:hypothetical protein